MKRIGRLTAILAGVVLAAAGSYLIYTGRATRVPGYWEKTEGVVERSEIRAADDRRIAEIQFSYQAGGQRVLGRQLHFTPAEVDRVMRDLPQGKRITVYYDPARPENSRLGEPRQAAWRWAIAAALLGAGVGLALHGMRRRVSK